MEREQASAVQRMQDYVSAHLSEPITLKQLADAAGYSPFHAARAFKELVGVPPFEYIRSLRLSAAALKLRDSDERVLDVALDFLFGSHEGFTRAFHRAFGLAPARYRRETPPIALYTAYSARGRYVGAHANERSEPMMTTHLFTQVVTYPARRLLLRPGVNAEEYFAYCGEVGCDVWGVLCSVKEALGEPMGLWLPDSLRPAGCSRYAQGVEVPADYRGVVPEGFILLDLPPCRMMVFQGEPYDEEVYPEAIGAASRAIDQYDPTRYGYRWAPQDAPRFQLEPQGWRGYIEGRPVQG